MAGQPSGTVTFLFTDIEGSTKRWEHQPEAMAKAVARHDVIMREAIHKHNGHVFKTVGDAFCAVFPSAEDALAASVDAQKAIAAEPWGEIGPIRVRMGLHTGEAEERDADYFGPTVNRVARITSAGHGGQALVSGTTGEHVEERLPPDVRLRSLGKHRLKDLARPERILQIVSPGLPSDFPRLKTVPSPTSGMLAALLPVLLTLVSFRLTNRASSEGVTPSLLSPLSLYTGFKGLIIELSTWNEFVLLGVGGFFLLLAIAIGIARWRAIRREQELRGDDDNHFQGWIVNQRTVAFLAVLALIVLGSYAYQQYLWRVVLPIPDNALGIAMTREASAATVQEELADSLYTQGQAEQVIVRELPVVFDARDTDRARAMGKRIGARAVIIYRADESTTGEGRQYTAYVVFTNPSIGLSLGGVPDASNGEATEASPTVQVKEGVAVPVIRTDTLEELINAAAGIIAYDDNDPRKAIEHLELAVPESPDAPNTGIVNFYLGNAYSLDSQPSLSATAYESAAGFYEKQLQSGENLGPQDQLVLVKTYLERGRLASMEDDWEGALEWYQKALTSRSDLLSRSEGLERPTDVPATYARLYTLMADAYRFQGLSEDQRVWEERAAEEIESLIAMADPDDTYARVQESSAQFFLGNCVGASETLKRAIEINPDDIHALGNAGIVALLQGRPDLAEQYWARIIELQPDDVMARQQIANTLTIRALEGSFFEPAYFLQAEEHYRQTIAVDPTNVYARDALADAVELRAQNYILDSSALQDGNDLAFARSQIQWPLDPDRRQEALDAFATMIDERRVIASELQPGDPEAEVGVAEAYLERMMLIYSVLLSMQLSNTDNPDMDAMGKQILADSVQTREWSQRVLDNPSASRLDKLRAWAALAEAVEREWGWYTFFAEDEVKSADLEKEHRQILKEAIAFGEAQPIAHVDEISPLRIIYFKALFVAEALDADANAASSLDGKIQALTQQEQQGREEGITHYTTFCTEVQEQQAGDAELARGDAEAAQEHYKLALEANPSHVASLRGLSAAQYQLGDTAGAMTSATTATEIDPAQPESWADLAFYNLVQGDTAAAGTAYDRFFLTVDPLPSQASMASVQDALEDLATLLEDQPERATELAAVIPGFTSFLDGMEAEGRGSNQYPALYASLGRLALFADQAEDAEPLLRQAIKLDTHQPAVHADLVISLLVQGKSSAPDAEAAFAEVQDPMWSRISGYEDPNVLLDMMEDEVGAYVERFPDRESMLEPFTSQFPAERERQQERLRGIEGTTYTSANFDYEITWDATWSVNKASTDPGAGSDSLQLTNGVSTVQFSAADLDFPDAASCLEQTIRGLESEEAWSAVEPAKDNAGQDVSVSGEDLAYAIFLDAPDSADPFVYYLDCRRLGTDGVFATVMALVPANAYEPERQQLGELIAFSASSQEDSTSGTFGSELPEINLAGIDTQVPAVSNNVYTSPSHGYSVQLGPPWTVVATVSENAFDSLQLSDGDDELYIQGFTADTAEPNTCIGEVASELSKDETLSGFSAYEGSDGKPVRGSDDASAFALFTFSGEDDTGSQTQSILYIKCETLPGNVLLRVLHLSTPENFEKKSAAREELLGGLTPGSQGDAEEATPEPAATPEARGRSYRRQPSLAFGPIHWSAGV